MSTNKNNIVSYRVNGKKIPKNREDFKQCLDFAML